jgi:hypothetical protein
MTAAGAEDRAKTKCGEDGEEESGEPVREVDGANGVDRCLVVNVAEAEERYDSGR